MFDEFITAVAFPPHLQAGHILLSPPTARSLLVSGSVSLLVPGRNVGPRGGPGLGPGPGPGPGPMANFNRSTEDLRMKQQSANYGRLRECLSQLTYCLF